MKSFLRGTRSQKRARSRACLSLAVLFGLQTVAPQMVWSAPVASSAHEHGGTLLLPMTPKIDESEASSPLEEPQIKTVPTSPAAGATEDAGDTTAPDTGSKPASTTPQGMSALGEAASGSFSNSKSPNQVSEDAPDKFSVEIDIENNPDLSALDQAIQEDTTLKGNIQIVADDTEFNQENNTFLGTGNAVALIGGQDSKLEADMILYDQTNEIIDARGNVRIIRQGQVTTGSAFKFKVSSDEYLITDADTEVDGATVIARHGAGNNEGITFKKGEMTLPEPIYYNKVTNMGPSYMQEAARKKAHPDAYVPEKSSFKFKAKKMVYEKYKENGNLTCWGGEMMFGNFGVPIPKFSCTVNKDKMNNIVFPVTPSFGNNMQIGGINIGPRFNHAIGKTGKLTYAPLLQIGGRNMNGTKVQGGKMGIAGHASYQNDRMMTNIATGSVNNMLVADLHYKFTPNSRLQSGINRFLEDGMYGARRARFAGELIHKKSFTNVPFFSAVNFRSSAGAYQDNPSLVNLSGTNYSELFGNAAKSTVMTKGFKIQEHLTANTHPFLNIGDDKVGLKAAMYGGVGVRAYSTGAKNMLAQVGPTMDVNLNRARFNIGYTQSAVRGDDSPFVFDKFIQGSRSMSLAGDFKINKYLTLGGNLGYNLQQKMYYNKSISAAIGPDDFKLLLTRDTIRGINRFGFDFLYGAPVAFDKAVFKMAPDHGQLGGI